MAHVGPPTTMVGELFQDGVGSLEALLVLLELIVSLEDRQQCYRRRGGDLAGAVGETYQELLEELCLLVWQLAVLGYPVCVGHGC